MAREREGDVDDAARPLLLVYAALAHVVILVVVFWSVYRSNFSDVPIYYRYASRALAGAVPYRDFAVEYPPAALIFFGLPRLVATTLTQYYVAFRVEVVIADLLILVALNAIARRRGLNRVAVLGAYTVFVLTVGPIIGQDFDIFPAATVVCALWFAGRSEWFGASIMLAVGILTKLYPLLLVPVFAMQHVRARAYGLLVRCAIVGTATMVVLASPLLLVAPRNMLGFLDYHAARGVHAESTYGSLLVAASKLHLVAAAIEYNFSSWNMSGHAAAVVKPLSTVLMLAAVVVVYAMMYRRTRRDEPVDLAAWSALVLFAGLVTSKVLSPQYLIWVMPLVPLIAVRNRALLWTLFALTGVVTYYIFPLRYMALVRTEAPDAVVGLVLRNLLLVVTTVVLARGLRLSNRLSSSPS
ncbi:MAG TPA: glycosyltransferase family 87 protein [Gemmatimonadaceae bacterium]|nr:glycosyltransferase family 87 protein [Gemmatimonadaceae bacterium]